jgi:chloramphenicol-sensitive protein RarD
VRGLLLALAAYSLWGCFPLFFSLLAHVPAYEVLAQRIVWACAITLTAIVAMGQARRFAQLVKNFNLLKWLSLSSLLISINWLVFIWAVSHQRILEASLGYFLTPLFSVVLGRLILKESLNRWQAGAASLAFLSVTFELFALGQLPWISLVLASSFGFYGLVRKQQPVGSLLGLAAETLLATPVALGFLLWQIVSTNNLSFGGNLMTSLLLIAAGAITTVPLLLFAAATARLDLTVVGFIMYLNPTIQFLTAVFILEEPYPPQRLVTFIIIWMAMGLFMIGLWRSSKARRRFTADEKLYGKPSDT